MVNKVLLSFTMVGLLAATAKATEVVSTNAWFTATIPTTVEAANASPWTTTAGCSVSISGGAVVDTDASKPLYYTKAEQTADGYRVKARINFTVNASVPSTLPTINSNTARAGLMAAITRPGVTNWYGVTGSEAAWNVLSGHTPVDGTDYDITVEFKTNATVNLVRYSVGNTVVAADGASNGWSELGVKFSPTLFGLAGYGTIKALSADTMSYFELTVTSDALIAGGIGTDNAATIIDDLNAEGANGLPRWESLVLGLNPMDANAKPYAAPVQTAGNTLGFTIGNVNTAKYGSVAEGATVTFDVLEKNNQGEWVEASGTATGISKDGVATVTPDSANVKYYKIKIKITK